jgi:formylglycine-generating enzyme required for sulfatase activity
MTYIPAGDFLMGDDDLSDNPRRTVYLDGYSIYKNDVTVGMYKEFCQATGHQMPPAPDFDEQWSKEDHPIVDVSWDDAKAYCDWAGVSLPTEAQWEKAARGTDGRKYPWGNDWDAGRCANSVGNNRAGTSAVGSYPSSASPYGVLDMAGNVWNWCADWYNADYYKSSPTRNPSGPGFSTLRALRGGSWDNDYGVNFRAALRGDFIPADRGGDDGFRGASGL